MPPLNPEDLENLEINPELPEHYVQHRALVDAEKQDYNPQDPNAPELPDEIENVEANNQAGHDDEGSTDTLSDWTHKIPVIGQAKWALDSAALGVGDFAADAIGLVPWLKPIDDWWDKNSARSDHPAHKIIRDASSVIIPSLAGGTWLVGGAKAAVAARAITLPKYASTLGTIAAYTGVDTGVAMISSHSKTDDNMAATLNNWLGWGIPWATRPGDDPDTRWKKNVMESAGLAAGVELIGAAFTFGKKAKLFPRDTGAEQAIRNRDIQLELFEDPVSAATQPRMNARTAAHSEEMIEALKADPAGQQYNAFVNDLGPDDAGRAVTDLEADPLQAKLHQTQIQNNIGTYNGRSAPVASEDFQRQLMKSINSNERAKQLDQLFNSFKPDFDAAIISGGSKTRITAEQMNQSVDNLTQALFGKDISFKEFEVIVDDMKASVFNSSAILDEDQWKATSHAFRKGLETMFDPNQMRASAMLTQQAGDAVTDAAAAAKMLGDNVDTSRQFEIMFKKLNLLDTEMRVNKYISSKASEYKRLIGTGNPEATVSWITRQSDEFDKVIKQIRATSDDFTEELTRIAKEDPAYYKPLKEAYYATNGNVDELHKLHVWTEKNIGLLKKGIIDGDPEIPSLIVKGLHGVRVNSVLSGLSPLRAAVGNSVITFAKPISIFAGAAMQGNAATLKRASYTFGGIGENFRRGLKMMQKEWNLAMQYPEEAMMRGRADIRMAKMENMEALDAMAEVWRRDGEHGKIAMWNMAKGLTWWNKQSFVRYGTNALYAIDGFTNSFMASGMARARAYDEVMDAHRGALNFDELFNVKQRQLYANAFDETGLLTDKAAKFASQEIALNLDNKVTQQLDRFLDHVPAAKGLFMFPRTGVNALELGWSYNPMSNLGPAMTRARRVLGAHSRQQKLAALAEHGIDATQDADLAFQTLKSEYLGRQIMGSTVVMGVGLWALEGNVTGNGPQDDAERRRMMAMGWQPLSIKNPITGEWRSYRGFEPFDTLMGLTADVIYQANRADQSITEDFLRKISFSISMNMTNDTFLGGFEPLVGLISGDPSAWTRFWAQQTDMLIPYKGMRTVLNNIVHPQLNDVKNDFGQYLLNANKFMSGDSLTDMLDIYTGKPIRYHDPLTNAFNAVLPVFKQNGDLEPWRQWLLSTGWDGLQRIRKNKHTGLPLDPGDRQFMNNWIAKNAGLKQQILKLMTESDGFWNKKLQQYKKERGLKTQNEFPIKQMILHKELDRIHKRAFAGAWNALDAYNHQYTPIGRMIKTRNQELRQGRIQGAGKTLDYIKQLQQAPK